MDDQRHLPGTNEETGLAFQHKLRGGKYTIIGRAILQTDVPVPDNTELVVYEGENGQLWVRAPSEFYDGRFIPLKPL